MIDANGKIRGHYGLAGGEMEQTANPYDPGELLKPKQMLRFDSEDLYGLEYPVENYNNILNDDDAIELLASETSPVKFRARILAERYAAANIGVYTNCEAQENDEIELDVNSLREMKKVGAGLEEWIQNVQFIDI